MTCLYLSYNITLLFSFQPLHHASYPMFIQKHKNIGLNCLCCVLVVPFLSFSTLMFSLCISHLYFLTTFPLSTLLVFSFWLHFFIISLNYYSKLCFIFHFLPKSWNFLFSFILCQTKMLQKKPFLGGNGGAFLVFQASSNLLMGKRSLEF